jgi:formiminotetrahydrofolate cyclodeaminase
MLATTTLAKYLDDLASAEPAPGGGSAAALTGALAAALVSMVCNLTLNDVAYASVHGEASQMLRRSETLRARLLYLAEEDARVAGSMVQLVHALRRDQGAEHSPSRSQVQDALKGAAGTALAIAEACAESLQLSGDIARLGKAEALSDAGVAAVAAEAGLSGAAMTVEINLALVSDLEFVRQRHADLDRLSGGKDQLRDEIVAYVRNRL